MWPTVSRSFYTEGGCFIDSDVRNFDHTFFGIHPREVASLDPAQRKFLEVVYEAFESGGIPMDKLAGSNTGCFVGNFNYDHQLMQYRDAEYPQPYSVTGGGITVLSNRVNYISDLKGPSMTLDTACPSSMYALHMACTVVQTGECTAAVVGGSNLILTPECQLFSSMLGAVSPTFVCYTFDASADEIGALYIKRLSDAVKDGDPIRAVIRGTAVDANGRTGAFTHPSPDGQEAVIRRAYERAGGLDPKLTGYFECHSTGTAVGDPLEINAIGRVFAGTRSFSTPLLIGSTRSNMGHSEPTSGIAGIMKAVVAVEHGIIPPTVGLKTINPNIDLKDGRLQVVTESTKWPDLPIRRASINSFGYGGANAHAIIESVESILPGYRSSRQTTVYQTKSTAPVGSEGLGSTLENDHINGLSNGYINGVTNGHGNGAMNGSGSDYIDAPRRRQLLLPFSAHDEKTLQKNFIALGEMSACLPLADVAYTLSARRSMLTHRGFVVAEVGKSEEAFATERISVAKKQSTIFLNVAFVFTGALRLPPNQSSVHDAEMSQPLVTAIQIAIVNLLASWGLIPSAVVGHSSGEIAAAYSAGLITEQEAIITAYLRGKAVSRNVQDGEMMAVGTDALELLPDLATEWGPVIVACHNSPESLTLSGDTAAVEEVKGILQRENKFARVLATGGNAYHSHHMQHVGEGYENEMHVTAFRVPSRGTSTTRKNSIGLPVRFFSSVYGKQFPSKTLGPHYWRENLESPVLFHEAVSEMVTTMQPEVLVEIGPHSALMAPLRQISKSMSSDIKFPEYLSAIKRNSNNVRDMLELAGTFFVKGYHIDLARVNAVEDADSDKPWVGTTVIDLPHYQWQYPENILLHENRYTKEWRLRMHPRHDVLGSRVSGSAKSSDASYRSRGGSLEDIQTFEFTDVSLQNALIVPEDDLGVETLFSMRPASLNNTTRYETRFDFILTSVASKNNEETFVDHCRDTVNVVLPQQNHQQSDLIKECETSRPYQKDISAPQWYENFAQVGLNYGPSFQGLSSIKISESTNLAEAKIGLKPTAQLMAATKFKRAFMPVAFESIKFWPRVTSGTTEVATSIAKGKLKGVRGLTADLVLVGAERRQILEAKHILLIASDQNTQSLPKTNGAYRRAPHRPKGHRWATNDIATWAFRQAITVKKGKVLKFSIR
ncbi:MAG: hypothetical protein LQ350_005080 [Teloschistes chrysophthalmus]|nr:MAG: hypothetical protein LQ350_005080 [Niorma chrysophthalma]